MSFVRKLNRQKQNIVNKNIRKNYRQQQQIAGNQFNYIRTLYHDGFSATQHRNYFVSIFKGEAFEVCLEYNKPLSDLELKGMIEKYRDNPASLYNHIVSKAGDSSTQVEVDKDEYQGLAQFLNGVYVPAEMLHQSDI